MSELWRLNEDHRVWFRFQKRLSNSTVRSAWVVGTYIVVGLVLVVISLIHSLLLVYGFKLVVSFWRGSLYRYAR